LSAAPRLKLAPLWWLLGCGLVAGIVAGTLAPPSDLPRVAQVLPDKLEHFSAYLGLSAWFAGLVGRSRRVVLAGALLVLGGALEGAQYVMHVGRAAEWLDMVANTCGVLAGLGLAAVGLDRWPAAVERGLGLAKDAA
jgi:VanZ family protein